MKSPPISAGPLDSDRGGPWPRGFAEGVERLAAWSDLIDAINVFPVADGDTGKNLVVTLAPLRNGTLDAQSLAAAVASAAVGNSGNIGAAFLSGFLAKGWPEDLGRAAARGRDAAYHAVAEPKPGTMLTLFDTFADQAVSAPFDDPAGAERIIESLDAAVRSTTDSLPVLKAAGVVDAGALGLFVLLESVLLRISGRGGAAPPIPDRFGARVRLSPGFRPLPEPGYCVQTFLHPGNGEASVLERIRACGESVVISRLEERLKVHLHTDDLPSTRKRLERIGRTEGWSQERMAPPKPVPSASDGDVPAFPPIHVMTDGAGSLDRRTAEELGITLLDSTIVIGGRSLPESELSPDELYAAMRSGRKVSTAQAPTAERRERYRRALDRHGKVLYLCVGSAYTGNYAAATAWQGEHDGADGMAVIDTGAASGRLAVLALAVARYARAAASSEAVVRFAETILERCEEYLYLEQLGYLAASGRLSRTGAFFGDMFHVKPIITPRPEGARKVGVVRSRRGQVRHALSRLAEAARRGRLEMILLEYSDNREWVEAVAARVREARPESEVLLQPLSLTSGAHMGPGTWGVAFLAPNPSARPVP